MSVLNHLREFTFGAAVFRLLMAQCVGALIGYGRSKKVRNAGLRTYMLVCMGSCLTILISLYEFQCLSGPWAPAVQEVGMKFDGSRYAAGVISGVGFLAAGTILGVEHHQVSGLTSAIGLFTTACLGLAVGAGFYEAVFFAAIFIIVSMETLQPAEVSFKRGLRNITVCVEYNAPEDLERILKVLDEQGAKVHDLDREPVKKGGHPTAVMSVHMSREQDSHSGMLSSVAQLPGVLSVRELIA